MSVGIDNDIWVVDLLRTGRIRLTTDRAAPNLLPISAWSSDGHRVVFSRTTTDDAKPNATTLEWRLADASMPAEILLRSDAFQFPGAWSSAAGVFSFTRGDDLWILEGSSARPWLATTRAENAAVLSPDGRWIAYVSDESGTDEIYVQAYPGAAQRQTVSTQGGREPVWSRNGRELFYRNGDSMMAVSITTTPTLTLGQPRMLFEGAYIRNNGPRSRFYPFYDVAADGRFLMVAGPSVLDARLLIVQNWFEELKRLGPAS